MPSVVLHRQCELRHAEPRNGSRKRGDELETLTSVDLINLVSAIAAGVLAIVALALSIVFFILAKRDADQSAKNAAQIASSVERLEKLFDSLYSDTFSMMRETYTDMRKHVWTAVRPSDDKPAEAELAADTAAILEKVGEVSKEVGVTGKKLEELQSRLQPLLADALAKEKEKSQAPSKSWEPEIRFHIRMRDKRGRTTSVADLARILKVAEMDLIDDIFNMGRSGALYWEGAPDTLGTSAVLRLESSPSTPKMATSRESRPEDNSAE
jgi:hypothetical protein